MAELQVLNGPLQWKTFKVSGPRFLVGRKDTCDLILKDGWVSREHSVLIETGGSEFAVQDLDSENGIYVNGERVKDSRLAHTDVLRIGRTEMRFFNPVGEEEDRPRAVVTDDPEPESFQDPADADSDGFDTTVQDPGRLRGRPRSDYRERLRKLEKFLLVKEEENSRLAGENAVLKRALAQGGLIDRSTGLVDMERLATSGPRMMAPTAIPQLISNHLAQMMFPTPDGGVLDPAADFGKADLAIGVYRLGIVGAGAAGSRLAGAFYRAGWRQVAAVGTDEDALESSGLLGEMVAVLPRLDDQAGLRDVARVLDEHRDSVETVLGSALGHDRTLHLVTTGLGGRTGVGAVPPLLERLQAVRMAAQPGSSPVPVGLLLSVDPSRVVDENRVTAARAGVETLRRLHDGGKLRPFLVYEKNRLEFGSGETDQELTNATLAGAVDALVRLPLLEPVAGDLDGPTLQTAFGVEGMSSLGLAGVMQTDEESLDALVRHALGDGWLWGGMPPSRGRLAVIAIMIGSEALAGDPNVVERSVSAVETARGILPQATLSMGIYGDNGPGVRAVAWVGGLPFPEDLVP